MKKVVLIAALPLMFLSCCMLSAQKLSTQNREHRIRNIVLIHGAWADSSGLKAVYDILTEDGFYVTIVQEPETSFQDDVAATKRPLCKMDRAFLSLTVTVEP
jgi:hypothetical protein